MSSNERTAEALRQIKARIAAATAGPWRFWEHPHLPNYERDRLHGVSFTPGGFNETHFNRRGDSLFVAHARCDMEALVEVAECALEYLAANGGKLPRDYRPNGGAETADKLEQALEALGQRHDAAAPEDAGEEG